jgi:hypothetical protein
MLLTLLGAATALLEETWVWEDGRHRAVASWRQLGAHGWAWWFRLLLGAAAFDAGLWLTLRALWAWHPVVGVVEGLLVGALFGPAFLAALRERRGAEALRHAVSEVKRSAGGPVYEAAALAATGGGWAGMRLILGLLPMADQRRATIVLRSEGEGRRRMYERFGFIEVARARLFWGECAVMVRPPADEPTAAVMGTGS